MTPNRATKQMTSLYFTALLMAISGAGHCLSMCGGISTALGLQQQKATFVLAYSAGRLISYMLAGIAFALLFTTLPRLEFAYLKFVSCMLMILVALHLGGWFSGLLWLEQSGKPIWQLIQPLTRKVLPINSHYKALFAGAIWGWLPCGLVYSAVAIADSSQQPFAAATIMLIFGLGTLPAMLSLAFFSRYIGSWLQKKWLKRLLACLLLLWPSMNLWQLL